MCCHSFSNSLYLNTRRMFLYTISSHECNRANDLRPRNVYFTPDSVSGFNRMRSKSMYNTSALTLPPPPYSSDSTSSDILAIDIFGDTANSETLKRSNHCHCRSTVLFGYVYIERTTERRDQQNDPIVSGRSVYFAKLMGNSRKREGVGL